MSTDPGPEGPQPEEGTAPAEDPVAEPEPQPQQQLTFVAPGEDGSAEMRRVRADGSLPDEEKASNAQPAQAGNRAERRKAQRSR